MKMKYDENNERTVLGISMDNETKARFKQLAKERHMTVSAMLTAWVWDQKLNCEKEGKNDNE